MIPNELYHHGVLGMHWGIRRYQPYPKGYSGSGREIGEARRGSPSKRISLRERREAKKRQRIINDRLQKAREAAAEKRIYEKEKKQALERGSASDLSKFKGDLTPNEIQTALNRIEWEKKLDDAVRKEKEAGFRKVDDVMKKIKKGDEWVGTGISIYKHSDEISKILKSLSEDSKKKDKKSNR